MVTHAQACLPEECCGLLAGFGSTVRRAVPVENVEHSPVRYRMEPQGQVEAMLALERTTDQLVGIFHSHPRGPAGLSPTDLAEARYPECIYLVLSPGEEGWMGRAYRLDREPFRQVSILVDDRASQSG